MDKKRILLLIGFIGVTILIGYLLYRVFFYRPPVEPLPPAPTTTTTPGIFPAAGEGAEREEGPLSGRGLPPRETRPGERLFEQQREEPTRVKRLVSDYLHSPTASRGGGAQYYNEQDGKFYKIGKDGTLELLSDQTFFNVQSATWAQAGDRAILEYPDGANIFYDFTSEQQYTLPKHWEDFSFAQTGDQIVAKSMGLSPENRWLVVSDPDGSDIRTVERLGNFADKVTVDWSPTRDVLGFSETGDPLGADRQEILLIGQHGENFKSLTVEGRGFESAWSPTGQQILYSVYSARTNFLPEIWVSKAAGDDIGKNRRPLSINTWADKCTFAGEEFVYCGVPTQLETGIGFAPALADEIPDELYRIDLETGIKTKIELDDTHVVDRIFLGEDGQTLYFTDKHQSGIFEVSL